MTGLVISPAKAWKKHAGLLLVKRFNYDCQHRLIKAEMPDGTVARYTYDAFNRRLSKTVNNVTTLFIWRGHRLAAQMEGDRENYRNYIYRPNSFEPLAMTCHHSFEYDYYQEHRHTDRTLPVKQKPEVYWYQNDHLGTPHCLTDAHGQAVWKSSYLAFGSIKTEANNGAGIDNPLRFAGQYHDRETGLFYNLNRYYDPTMKRYLTQDPVGLAGGLNLYLYVDANPISWLDPLGLFKLSSSGTESCSANSQEPAIPESPGGYSVAFETQLDKSVFGSSRKVHFNRGNAALDDAMNADPEFAKKM
ncbi:MAG: RHS repeat-associated core domain-containing protein [Hafnia sp.]